MQIDINADLGEGFGPYNIADDASLLQVITSANIACGYHAGDPVIMDRTVRLAVENRVDLGAHVSFPDRMGFGRRIIQMDVAELEQHVIYQLGALDAFARIRGSRIAHMNPHGALGNLASSDEGTAAALVRAAGAFDKRIRFLVLPGSALEKAAHKAGMSCYRLFLADRAYTTAGQLVPRSVPGAVIKDETQVIARLLRLVADRTVETICGAAIPMEVNSVLVHSDTPGAVDLARTIRSKLLENGVSVTPLSRQD